MIARLWFGNTLPVNAEDYARHLHQTIFPELQEIPGHRGAYVLRREREEDVEFAVLTLWASMEAVRAFAGEDPGIAVVPPEAQALLHTYDATVRHFEMAEVGGAGIPGL